jgi:hypothetical protein
MSGHRENSTLARAVRLLASVALVASMGALSRLPYSASDEGETALRLSWRFRGEEAASCRRPTEAELEELPAHMRNPDACSGTLPSFELRVEIDGETKVARMVRPSGARGDRPVFVYHELRLSPGIHRVAVRFGPADAPEPPTEVAIRALLLDTLVSFDPDRVLLVTRGRSGALEVREPVRQ